MGFCSLPIWSSWSYSHENGPLRSSTSVSSSHHAKMWGVNHAIFGIIRNAMSYSITRWNMTTFWRANFMLYHFKSKICSFINIYFHQTQSARANRYHWTLPPLKNIVPYSICFASIIRAKEAFFNKTNEIISYNMHAVALLKFSRDYLIVLQEGVGITSGRPYVTSGKNVIPIKW